MEYPEGQFSQRSECNSKLKTLISETISFQEPKIVVDSGTKTASDYRTQIAGEPGTSTLVDHGAQSDAYVGAQGDAQAAARPPLENLTGRKGKWLMFHPRQKNIKDIFGSLFELCDPLEEKFV